MIVYMAEAFFLYACTGSNTAIFIKILYIITSIALIIILLNWGKGQGDYSEVLLSYYYLVQKRRKRSIVGVPTLFAAPESGMI